MKSLSYADVRRNELMNYAEVLLITPFIVVVQQYVPVLAARLGATPLMLGALTSASALILAIASASSSWYLRRAPDGMRAMFMPTIVYRSVLIWIPLVLLLPVNQVLALVALMVVLSFFNGLVNVTFTSLLPRFTWPERLPTLISWRWTALGVGMAIATPVLGVLLDAFLVPVNWFVVCGVALVFTAASTVFLFNMRPAPSGKPHMSRTDAGVRTGLKQILANKRAAHYLLVTLLAQIALNAAGPLITLQLVRDLGANDAQIGVISAIFWACLAVSSVVMPAVVQRFGNAKVYALSGLGLALQLVVFAVAPSIAFAYFSGLFGGVSSVMFQVSQFGLILDSAPESQYVEFVSAQSTAANLGIFIGPLAATALVTAGMPVVVGLLLCAIGRALATVLVLRAPARESAPSPSVVS